MKPESEPRRGQEQGGGAAWAVIAGCFALLLSCSSAVAIRTLPL